VVKPEPLLEVPGGAEASFLAPHPLDVLPELHPRMRRRLDDYQLDLIGEVAVIPESALCAVFGGAGRSLRAQARGIDPRPVLPPEQQAEFHVAHALATDTNDPACCIAAPRSASWPPAPPAWAGGAPAQVALTYVITLPPRAVPLTPRPSMPSCGCGALRNHATQRAAAAVRMVEITLTGWSGRVQLELWEEPSRGGTTSVESPCREPHDRESPEQSEGTMLLCPLQEFTLSKRAQVTPAPADSRRLPAPPRPRGPPCNMRSIAYEAGVRAGVVREWPRSAVVAAFRMRPLRRAVWVMSWWTSFVASACFQIVAWSSFSNAISCCC
jgi:hypothetical protein